MTKLTMAILVVAMGVSSLAYGGGVLSGGAAPAGDAKVVATRIIKYNFPECKAVTRASRLSDGTIRATCDNIEYRVMTIYLPKEGKMLEVAFNCQVAKQKLGVDCF